MAADYNHLAMRPPTDIATTWDRMAENQSIDQSIPRLDSKRQQETPSSAAIDDKQLLNASFIRFSPPPRPTNNPPEPADSRERSNDLGLRS